MRCGKHLSRPASRLLEDGVTCSKPGDAQAPGGGGGKLSRPVPPPREGRRPNLSEVRALPQLVIQGVRAARAYPAEAAPPVPQGPALMEDIPNQNGPEGTHVLRGEGGRPRDSPAPEACCQEPAGRPLVTPPSQVGELRPARRAGPEPPPLRLAPSNPPNSLRIGEAGVTGRPLAPRARDCPCVRVRAQAAVGERPAPSAAGAGPERPPASHQIGPGAEKPWFPSVGADRRGEGRPHRGRKGVTAPRGQEAGEASLDGHTGGAVEDSIHRRPPQRRP